MARQRYLLASAVLLATTVLLVLGYAVFGSKTRKVLAQGGIQPVGSYGFQSNIWPAAPLSPAGTVGVINFDGAGGVTGSYTTYDPNSSSKLQTGTFTGRYSSNVDGTGSITIVPDMGDTQEYAMVITNSNSRVSFLQTNGDGSPLLTGVATLR